LKQNNDNKKKIAQKITELHEVGNLLGFDRSFLSSLTEAVMASTDEDIKRMDDRAQKEKAFYEEEHGGKVAHPLEMSLYYSAHRPEVVSYKLSAEEMDWFEKMLLSLSSHDFGYYKYPTPPAHMVELTRALKNLCATSDRDLVEAQEDTFSFFMENSEVFRTLSDAEASEDGSGGADSH
jgi:hypothetical protein